MGLELGILFGVMAMVGYGLSDAWAKRPSQRIGAETTLVYRNLFLCFILGIGFAGLVLTKRITVNIPAYYLFFTVGISILSYVGIAALFSGIAKGKISIIMPVSQTYAVITILLAIVFYREPLTWLRVLFFLLVLGGMVLLLVNFSKRHTHILREKGIRLAFVTVVTWGIAMFLLKIPSLAIGPIPTVLILELTVLCCALFHTLVIARKRLAVPASLLGRLACIGIFGGIASTSYLLGMQQAGVSIVVALSGSSPLVSVLYGRFWHGERLRALQYAGIAAILAGIVLLTIL